MSLDELMPLVQELPRADKQRLFDSLTKQLAAGENQEPANYDDYTTRNFRENNEATQKLADYLHQENNHEPSGMFEAWTPAQDGEAAQKLLDYLNAEKARTRV